MKAASVPRTDVVADLEARGLLPVVVRDLLARVDVQAPDTVRAVRCPWHDDHDPSLMVVGDKGFVECKGACGRRWLLLDLVAQVGAAEDRARAAEWLRAEYLNGCVRPSAPTRTPQPNRGRDHEAAWRLSREGLDWTSLAATDPRLRLVEPYPLPALEELGAGYAPRRTIRGAEYPPSLVLLARDPDGEPVARKYRALVAVGPDGAKSRTVGPGGRGLLGQEQLAAKPAALTVIPGGEKDMIFGLAALPVHAWVSAATGERTSLTKVARAFDGRDVVLLLDADKAGREGAEKAARCLAPHARRVRVADLAPVLDPGEKDVADLVQRVGTEAAGPLLQRVIDNARIVLPTTDVEGNSDDRPIVLVPGEHPVAGADTVTVSEAEFACEVLACLPEDLMYRHGEVLGELVPDAEGDDALRLSRLDLDRTRLLVSRHVAFAAWRAGGRREGATPRRCSSPCNRDRAGLVVAAARTSARVRELALLTPHPVFVGREMRLSVPGWNADTRVYYDEPIALRGLRPAEVEPGVLPPLLADLLIDFPLRDAASFQNAVGMLLTAFVRPALRTRTTPMHLALAPIERVGKTKLVGDVLGHVVLGRPIPAMQLPHREEEADKRILALLIRGGTVVHFDNLRGDLNSAPLASLLTADTYSGRDLGFSKIISVPNTLMVVASGNNVKATGELAKRSVPIWLDPRNDAPEERADFRHPDLGGYVASVRREVIAILLGMVETWKRAGAPAGTARLGGFEDWARIVGGVLSFFGCTDWLANCRSFVRTADVEGDDFRALVEIWAALGGSPMRASDLLQLIEGTDLFPSVRAEKEGQPRFATFGKFLASRVGVIVGRWKIGEKRSGSNRSYLLLPAADVPPRDEQQPPCVSTASACTDCGEQVPDDGDRCDVCAVATREAAEHAR